MKCYFCHQECHQELTHGTPDNLGTSDFNCDACQVTYEFFHGPHLVNQYQMRCGEWIAEFHMFDKTFTLWKNPINTDDVPFMSGWQHILDLDFLPDITPSNFEHKIKTFIPFL